ncbi:Hypothetical predicted protein, partial [Paramuricea clavata]
LVPHSLFDLGGESYEHHMTAMKMLWLLVSILVLHQAVAMERTKEPVKIMSELIRPVFGDK